MRGPARFSEPRLNKWRLLARRAREEVVVGQEQAWATAACGSASTTWSGPASSVRIEAEIDPHLEAAEIQRRVYQAGGPAAALRARQGLPLPDGQQPVRHPRAHALPVPRHARRRPPPGRAEGRPGGVLRSGRGATATCRCTLWHLRPKCVRRGPVLAHADDDQPAAAAGLLAAATAGRSSRCRRSTPRTPTGPAGGTPTSACTACSSPATSTRRTARSACTTRSTAASASTTRRRSRKGVPFRVNVFVGGPPAHDARRRDAAAGGAARAGLRRRARRPARAADRAAGDGLPIPADADFCIAGTVDPDRQLPEGPFGDHLGYYSLAHDFPVLNVEQVYHRADAIWPFTVVGRPPQEDTTFGADHPRADRAGHPDRARRRPRGPRRRCGRRPSAAAGHRQRALRPLRRATRSRRNCSPAPTPSSARGSCRWPSTC